MALKIVCYCTLLLPELGPTERRGATERKAPGSEKQEMM
jgi:hypothetical protein